MGGDEWSQAGHRGCDFIIGWIAFCIGTSIAFSGDVLSLQAKIMLCFPFAYQALYSLGSAIMLQSNVHLSKIVTYTQEKKVDGSRANGHRQNCVCSLCSPEFWQEKRMDTVAHAVEQQY